jgi:hypothetical protein
MKHDERVTGLLEANNVMVEKNRALRAMLRKAAKQFTFYGEQHKAKNTDEADSKALLNFTLAAEITQVLIQN